MDLAANRQYARALALGAGGALLFALPLLMTMEMWQLGFGIERWRLLLLFLLCLPMLLGLSYFAGFEATFHWRDEVLDTFAALAIGILLAAAVLLLLGALKADQGPSEVIGKIALCAIPGAMGALLAGKQFSSAREDIAPASSRGAYGEELFTMMVGALFLAFNIAPTDEVPIIAHQMDMGRTLLLVVLSLLLLHVTVYELGLPGQDLRKQGGGFVRTFLSFSVPGYAIGLLTSAYVLWTFGRLDGVSLGEAVSMMVTLGLPAALGCATARLVI